MSLTSHDGTSYVDRYGRTADECRLQATTAQTFAAGLRQILEGTVTSLTFGREGGPRCLRRLEVSAAAYDRMAARDTETADHLEEREAWLANAISTWGADRLADLGRSRHGIPLEALDVLIERHRVEFEETLERFGFADSQRARLQGEDRGRMTAILRGAELEAKTSGADARELVWGMLIAGEDPRFDEEAA